MSNNSIEVSEVPVWGILSEPDSAWVTQCGRQITDAVDGCLRGKRFLLHGRDPLFTDVFRETVPTENSIVLVV